MILLTDQISAFGHNKKPVQWGTMRDIHENILHKTENSKLQLL